MLTALPNLLTLLRIVACPVLVLLLDSRAYDIALALFLAAGITDGLDGYLAKKFNAATSLGAILDPIADKLLITSAYVLLAILEDIPFWLFIAVLFRDLVIIGGYMVLVFTGQDVAMKPTYLSKFNTFLQIALVVVVLGAKAQVPYLWQFLDALVLGMVYGVLCTTVTSGIQYVYLWGFGAERPNGSAK